MDSTKNKRIIIGCHLEFLVPPPNKLFVSNAHLESRRHDAQLLDFSMNVWRQEQWKQLRALSDFMTLFAVSHILGDVIVPSSQSPCMHRITSHHRNAALRFLGSIPSHP
mmetsp:Transcript_21528/g.61423  ORF Transcript_21528/g.61423 Transcript_21528/m.61423 type:complete len:109 (-) Transcript_21528:468-794(-)